MKTWNNEKGLTLVEILAALVILGIVFIGFMAVFPQMNKMNEHTETKLVSMNNAKMVLADLKKTGEIGGQYKKIKESKSPSLYETYEFRSDGYVTKLDCYDHKNQTCSGEGQEQRVKKQLYKIHIQVEKDGKVISESFGYLELE